MLERTLGVAVRGELVPHVKIMVVMILPPQLGPTSTSLVSLDSYIFFRMRPFLTGSER